MPSGRWAASKLPAKLPCDFEVCGCFFAAVYHNIERDGQCRQSGAFDDGNVDEHILAAVGARDKAVSLRGIEPFDNALVHRLSFLLREKRGRRFTDHATWRSAVPTIKLSNDNRVGGAGLTSTSPGRSRSVKD